MRVYNYICELHFQPYFHHSNKLIKSKLSYSVNLTIIKIKVNFIHVSRYLIQAHQVTINFKIFELTPYKIIFKW